MNAQCHGILTRDLANKKTTSPQPTAKLPSGATGGPSTARGVDYQLDYATYHALALISQHLAAPYNDLSITIEPRQVHGNTATRSDLRVTSTRTSAEVKLQPTKEDIVEWITRVANGPTGENHVLVYGSARGTLLATVAALIRIAIETGPDTAKLRELATSEQLKDHEQLLGILGEHAAERLQHLSLQNLPELVVQENIAIRANVLAPEHAVQFITEVKTTFLQGMKVRKTYHTRELVELFTSRGIALATPVALTLDDLPTPARNVLAALQHCPGGLPNAVIARTAACSPEMTAEILAVLVQQQTLHYDGNRWRLLIALPEIQPAAGVMQEAMDALVEFVAGHDATNDGRSLLTDAISLTHACFNVDPKAITGVFRKLEKLLKRAGNKYLVLELAELTIKAASQQPRSLEDARAQAHALICGSSWVYQRVGDLDTARTLARQSLTLGADISWDRNTAFCLKCEGRILRLQAERIASHRDALLTASAESITTAIKHFSNMTEIGPTHPEVGDCFSLLARTYLVAQEFGQAKAALGKAHELIIPNGSKDHLDLLILTGDLFAATGDMEAAERTYTEALQLPEAADVQVSEVFARGYYQRGELRQRLRRNSQAMSDYERAAGLWLHLDEFELSAKARWRHIYLEAPEEKPILDEIAQEESHLVRVIAYDLYQQRHTAPKAIARRKQPTKQQIAQLLKDARQETAIRYPHR